MLSSAAKLVARIFRSAPQGPVRSPLLIIGLPLLLVLVLAAGGAGAALAAESTTTTLTVSPGTPGAASDVLTLTASVKAGAKPVQKGSVLFCEAAAKACTLANALGSARLTRAGTATLKLARGAGQRAFQAVFAGSGKYAGSSSRRGSSLAKAGKPDRSLCGDPYPPGGTYPGYTDPPYCPDLPNPGACDCGTYDGWIRFDQPLPAGSVTEGEQITISGVVTGGYYSGTATYVYLYNGDTQVGPPISSMAFMQDGGTQIQLPPGHYTLRAYSRGAPVCNEDGYRWEWLNCPALSADSYGYTVRPKNKPTPSLTLTPQPPNSSTLGDWVTLTASIDPESLQGHSVTGERNITFYRNSTQIGEPAWISLYTANMSTNSPADLPIGTFQLKACYGGDDNLNPACSGEVPYTVHKITPSVSLKPTPPSPSTYGEEVTLTATITAPLGTVDDGTVTFYDGATPIGKPQQVRGGRASLSTSTLDVDTHQLKAQYDGDDYYNPAMSQPVPYTVSPSQITPHLSLDLDPQQPQNPWVYPDDQITMTARFDPTSLQGHSVDGEDVKFKNGGEDLHTSRIDGTQAQWPTTLAPGLYQLQACYYGDKYLTSDCSDAQTYWISQRTTLTLDPPKPPGGSVVGQPVTLTAHLSPNCPPARCALGQQQVSFSSGSQSLGSAAVQADGTATLTTTQLPSGNNTIVAQFDGFQDSAAQVSLGPSTSNPQPYTVSPPKATPTVVLNPTPQGGSTYGQTVTLTATINPALDDGTVTFYDGASTIGEPQQVRGGHAKLSTSTLDVRTHQLKARYSGDDDYAQADSSPVSYTVSKATPTLTLEPPQPPNESTVGQTVTLTANIDPKDQTDGMMVQFLDNTFTPVGDPKPLENGTASIQVDDLPVGTHSFTAKTDGNAYYTAADSNSQPYTVNPNKVTPVIGFDVQPNSFEPVYAGDPVTMTATIDPASLNGISLEGKQINFQNGDSVLMSKPISNNRAQWITTTLQPKLYWDLKACIGADNDVNAACSDPYWYWIYNKTTLKLDPPQPPGGSVLGAEVTLTAHLDPHCPSVQCSNLTNQYNVFFSVKGGKRLGSAPVDVNGTATLKTKDIPAGTSEIYASFLGVDYPDYPLGPSTSNTQSYPVDQSKVVTSLKLEASPKAGGIFTQTVTLTATLTPDHTADANTNGQPVIFYDGDTPLDPPGTLTNGVATFSTSGLPWGMHTFTAKFAGDGIFDPATSNTLHYAIGQMIVLDFSLNPSAAEQPHGNQVKLQAYAYTDFGRYPASGTVNFCETPTPAAACTGPNVVASGQTDATGRLEVPIFPGIGTHNYYAVFVGNAQFASATSTQVKLTVTGEYETKTSIAETGNADGYALTATVKGIVPEAKQLVPTGDVDFQDTSNNNFSLAKGQLQKSNPAFGMELFKSQTLPMGDGAQPSSVAVGDLNSDGHPDLAVANALKDNVEIYFGKDDGTFNTSPDQTLDQQWNSVPFSVVIGRFGPNASPGVAVGAHGSIVVFPANEDGTFQQRVTSELAQGDYRGTFLAVGDINRDGILDLVATMYNPPLNDSGAVRVLLGDGTGAFNAQPYQAVGPHASSVAIGDIDGDSTPDLAVASFGDGTVTIFLGHGDGTFDDPLSPPLNPGYNPTSVVLGDFDGDGNLDLAVASRLYAPSYVTVYQGDGYGKFDWKLQKDINPNWNRNAQLGVGDFNGDNILDLAIASYDPNFPKTTSDVRVWLGNGQWGFPTEVSVASGAGPVSLSFGDFNEDGILDMATADSVGNSASVVLSQPTALATATADKITIVGDPTKPHNVTATYGGDANFLASASDPVALTPKQKVPTTLQLSADPPNGAKAGEKVTLTAQVTFTGNAQGHQPGGTVIFKNKSVQLGDPRPVVNGKATLPAQTLPPGQNSLTAEYSGDDNFASSKAGPLPYPVIEGIKTSLKLKPDPKTGGIFGQDFTLTATLAAANGDVTSANNEPITFYDGATPIGTASLSNGVAVLTHEDAPLDVGVHTLTAQYAGNTVLDPATSNTLHYAVGYETTTTLEVQPASTPFPAGTKAALIATVYRNLGEGPEAPKQAVRGTVNFCDAAPCTENNILGSAQTNADGTATFYLYPSIGQHQFVAEFVGTADNAASRSGPQERTVTGQYATETLIAPPLDDGAGAYTLRATVTGFAPEDRAKPIGEVQFQDTSNTDAPNYVLAHPDVGSSAVYGLDLALSQTVNADVSAPGSVAVADLSIATFPATGDLRDGHPDLVVANAGAKTVTVYTGDGKGKFAKDPIVTIDVENEPFSVVIGDFNSDTLPDLAVGNGNQVSVYLAQQNGTFDTPAKSPIGFNGQGTFMAVGDVDRNGILDVVTTQYNPNNNNAGALTVLLGNSDGTFRSQPPITTRPQPTSMVIGDFDSDGTPDLAVSHMQNFNNVAIMLGDGYGAYQANPTFLNAPWNATSVVAADFNGDGNLDVAVGSQSAASPSTVYVFHGSGDGVTFTQKFQGHLYANYGAALAAADFNGDGVPDLGVLSYNWTYPTSTAALRVWLGDGNWAFTPPANLADGIQVGARPVALALGDLNEDGISDVVTANQLGNSASVVLSQPTTTVTATATGVTVVGNPQKAPHKVQATYLGDTNFLPSTSDTTEPVTPQKVQPELGLVPSPPNGAKAGQVVTLTATLTPYQAQGHTTKNEMIVFKSDGVEIGGGALNGQGVARTATADLEPGPHTLTAEYAGDDNFAPASASVPYQITEHVKTSLKLEVNPRTGGIFGKDFTLTATLDPHEHAGIGSDGELITFYDGATEIGSKALQGGVAILTHEDPQLGVGMHNLTAQYGGNTVLDPSTSNTLHYAVGWETATTLEVQPASTPYQAGTKAVLIATVSRPRGEGQDAPADPVRGTVNFCEATAPSCTGSDILGTAQLNEEGTATFYLYPSIGQHQFVAQFVGTAEDAASRSNQVDRAVAGRYPTETSIGPPKLDSDGSYTLSATVTGFAPEDKAKPTGKVEFQDRSNADYVLADPDVGTSAVYGMDLSLSQTVNADVSSPSSVAIADLSLATFPATGDLRDGHPDLVVANAGAKTVTIYTGDGKGGFATDPVVTIDVENEPYSVVIGDFNNDILPDLAVGNGHQVSVYLAQQDGTFGDPVSTLATLTDQGTFMALGDFDRNGILDLAVLDQNSPNSPGWLRLMTGDGSGTFNNRSGTVFTGEQPSSIAIGDVNNDGSPDFAVSNYGSGTVSIVLGNGDGTVDQNPSTLTPGGNPTSVVLADFDGDGNLDLAVGSQVYAPSYVTVYQGDGYGNFQPKPKQDINPNWNRLVQLGVGDFNGDNIPDLAIASYDPAFPASTSDARVWLGDGKWHFSEDAKVSVGAGPVSLALGDLKEDGIPDVVTANQLGNSASVVLSQPTATVTATATGVTIVGDPKKGPHDVRAHYDGDSNFLPSDSDTTVPVPPRKVQPELVLLQPEPPSPSMLGDEVTLTATLNPCEAQGHSAKDAPVAFKSNGAPIGNGTLQDDPGVPNQCVASITTTKLQAGHDVLTAEYAGDDNFNKADSNEVPYDVNRPPAAATLTMLYIYPEPGPEMALSPAVPPSAQWPTRVLLKAQVVRVDNGQPVTEGTVNFCDGTPYCTDIHQVGTAQLNSQGEAFFRLYPGIGTGGYEARFMGTNAYLASSGRAPLYVHGTFQTEVGLETQRGQGAGTYKLDVTVKGIAPRRLTDQAPTGMVDIKDMSNDAAPPPKGYSLVEPLLSLTWPASGIALEELAPDKVIFPASVASADFNQDGIPDLATADRNIASVTIDLGNGNGTFHPGPTPTLQGTDVPIAIVAADFNGDTYPDVAVGTQLGPLTVWLGNGNGTFQPPGYYGDDAFSSEGLVTLTIGDFNKDGWPDIAATQVTKVVMLLNDKHGHFAIPPGGEVTVPNRDFSMSAAAGDWDGDGNLDLAVGSVNVAMYWGRPSGTFDPGEVTFVDTSAEARSIATADFDGDGKLDMVATAYDEHIGDAVQFFKGNGSARTFTNMYNLPEAPTVLALVTTGDFNQDGHPDVAVVRRNLAKELGTGAPGKLEILLGHGQWNFTSGAKSLFDYSAVDIITADFNLDGFSDVAVADEGNYNVVVALTRPIYSLELVNAQTVTEGISDPRSIATGDINRDGHPDLAVGNLAGPTHIYLGKGGGKVSDAPDFSLPLTGAPFAVVIEDFTNDGLLDVAVGNGNQVSLFVQNEAGTFEDPVNTPLDDGGSPFSNMIVAGDFDRDGILDLAVTQSPEGNGTAVVLLGQGNGSFSPAGEPTPTGKLAVSVAVGDFDGNGILDLVVANSRSGNVVVLLSDGYGTFQPDRASMDAPPTPTSLVAADFDGDGNLDFAVGSEVGSSASRVYVYQGKGDGKTFTQRLNQIIPTNYRVALGVGDFDGDGNADLAIAGYAPGKANSGDIRIWRGDGQFGFNPAVTLPVVGAGPLALAVADFDGNGIPDLATANYVGSSASIVLAHPIATATASVDDVGVVGREGDTHNVVAQYVGDPVVGLFMPGASNPVELAAHRVPTTLDLKADNECVVTSDNQVTLTAKLEPFTAQAHTADGVQRVEFWNASKSSRLATMDLVGGQAIYTTQPGDLDGSQPMNILYAKFKGDDNFEDATSDNVPIAIGCRR